jgi:hypothetical protein
MNVVLLQEYGSKVQNILWFTEIFKMELFLKMI